MLPYCYEARPEGDKRLSRLPCILVRTRPTRSERQGRSTVDAYQHHRGDRYDE